MNLKQLYLLCAGLGLLLPWLEFLPFLLENGVDLGLFVNLLQSNPVIKMIWADLLLTGLVLSLMIYGDGMRLKIKGKGWVIAATFTLGPCFSLPLFLYLRESAAERQYLKKS